MTGHDDSDGVSPGDEALTRAARERIDRVEPAVAERLAQMRRNAVAELDARGAARPAWRRAPGLWAGGLAAAAAVALTLALLLPGATAPEADPVPMADADELEAIVDLEVLEELEFLAWLDEEQPDAGQG